MSKKNLLTGLLLVVLVAGNGMVQAAGDIFSVNFYAFGRNGWVDFTDEERASLTIEADEAAGVEDWQTTDWENIVVPWNPSAPQDPVTITSTAGATATFTLITARNGAPYHWAEVRSTLLDNANADLMDGHANATEDDGELFEMEVSDIPFADYDVIVYLGANEGQFGDGTGKIVLNGGPEQGFTLKEGEFDGTFTQIVDATTPGNYVLFEKLEDSSFTIQVWGNGFNHIAPAGFQIRQANPALAANPSPAIEATDVPREVVLSWSPGESAASHDIYFGTSFDDVSTATTGSAVYQGRQPGTSLTLDRLDFGTTYYWRIDEVNAPPDLSIFVGEVWNFTTEPVSYPLTSDYIAVTASSANEDTEGPDNVINGSGVDANDLHSTGVEAMWRTSMADTEPWIEFAFDRPYMLHEMLVWNHNSQLEAAVGFGVKEAMVEYSVDGVDWIALGTVELPQATGKANYAANGTVAFAGATAQHVRLIPLSNWGGILNQFGLSEVRFFRIPVRAREPHPALGQGDVDVTTTLTWRAGRQTNAHDVYVSTDEQAVIDGTAPMATVDDVSYMPALDLASTYYWRVDEVNEVETPSIWSGDLWSFSTQDSIVVDGFESYTDVEGEEIFMTWVDGFDDDTNGSLVGYGTSSNGTFGERGTVHGGEQSMPLAYDNTTATSSEATRSFDGARDWTQHGVQTLTLWFHGDPANEAQQMYVRVNNTKVPYDGDTGHFREPRWRQWEIDLGALADQGVDIQNVTQLGIGFDRIGGVGGQGLILVDDIRLSRPVVSEFPSVAIPVPNSDFEEVYKQGSTTVTADLGGGWTQGLGPDTPMDSGTATYSDGTTGDTVDIPGWIGADAQGWVDNGGSYDRDTAFPNRQGSVTGQSATPDGQYYYLANGGGWGNPAGGLIVSDAPVATVEGGLTYRLSVLAAGGATPVVLELLADGVPLTPTSSVDPDLSDDWQEFSRTYDAGSLEAHIGASLTIRLGVGRGASGSQTRFDAVSLSTLEPTVSLVEDFDSLAVGASMHDVDGWEGWFGDAQAAGQITDVVAYSGTQSVEIVGNRDDLVPHWPVQTSGQWTLTVMQYAPSDKQDKGLMYFGPLTQYDGATETVAWIGEFITNFETGKVYCNQEQDIQVDIVYDAWAPLRLEVDLDAKEAHFYYNDVFLATLPAASIAGVDMWPDADIAGVYFDDFSFEPAL